MPKKQPQGDLYGSLALTMRAKLLGAIFFTFAPLSVLMISRFEPKRSWAAIAAYAVLGGFTAVCWAYAFLRSKRVFWILIPSQALWFVIPAFVFRRDFRTGFTFSIEGTACIALIVLGYVLFISYIRREGARTIRMQTELALAQQIHAALIPPVTMSTPRLELFGRSVAGAEMGGDLIDVVEGDGQTDVFIADVSGHGVKAGVIMAVVKSAIRTRLRGSRAFEGLFQDVNHVVCELAGPGMFVTAACLRFGTDGQVRFCGAGHGPILHFRNADGHVGALESEHLPFGVAADETFEANGVHAQPGDVFLLMTDGLTEVFDDDDRMLGQPPIEELLRVHARAPLRELYESVMTAVRTHGPQADDQTLLLVRVLSGDGRPRSG